MIEIPLHGRIAAGRVALIDDDDLVLVKSYRWFATERSRPNGRITTYALGRTPDDPTLKYMHALITGYPRTDHRNRNGLDNQRANLRPATQALNNANQGLRSDSTSGFKGVSLDRARGTWKSYIVVGGRQRYLGRFADELSAARAYDRAATAAYGEFALLNFEVTA